MALVGEVPPLPRGEAVWVRLGPGLLCMHLYVQRTNWKRKQRPATNGADQQARNSNPQAFPKTLEGLMVTPHTLPIGTLVNSLCCLEVFVISASNRLCGSKLGFPSLVCHSD